MPHLLSLSDPSSLCYPYSSPPTHPCAFVKPPVNVDSVPFAHTFLPPTGFSFSSHCVLSFSHPYRAKIESARSGNNCQTRRILLIVPLRQHFQLEGCACVCLCRFQHLQTVSLSIALFDLWVNLMGPPLRLMIVALFSPMLMVQTEKFCSCRV